MNNVLKAIYLENILKLLNYTPNFCKNNNCENYDIFVDLQQL